MKFLFFTDTHIRGTNPRNRKDDFYQTLKNKFEEILHICRKLNVDYILHGGDWFDRPDVSPSIVREFAVIIRKFGRPVYTVAGNHDLFGQNPETIGRTMLGLLEGTGIVKLLDYGEKVMLEKNSIKVQLTGSSYNYDIDSERYRDFYTIKKGSDVNYAVNIVHGMLLSKPFIQGISYTLLDDIVETEADVTLSGHYHSGFGIIKKESKYFANPGSMVRIANSISEINRVPGLIVIDVEKELKLQEIKLETALPGNLVLDRSMLEDSRDRKTRIQNFYRELENSCDYKRINLNSIINEIALNNDIDEGVKNEAIRRISTAREEISLKNEE